MNNKFRKYQKSCYSLEKNKAAESKPVKHDKVSSDTRLPNEFWREAQESYLSVNAFAKSANKIPCELQKGSKGIIPKGIWIQSLVI